MSASVPPLDPLAELRALVGRFRADGDYYALHRLEFIAKVCREHADELERKVAAVRAAAVSPQFKRRITPFTAADVEELRSSDEFEFASKGAVEYPNKAGEPTPPIATPSTQSDRAAVAPPTSPQPLEKHLRDEVNYAHRALDDFQAPRTKWTYGRDGNKQEMTLGLADRIAALRTAPPTWAPDKKST